LQTKVQDVGLGEWNITTSYDSRQNLAIRSLSDAAHCWCYPRDVDVLTLCADEVIDVMNVLFLPF